MDIEVNVTGISFRLEDAQIGVIWHQGAEPVEVQLVREPDNPHDPHAIMVLLCALNQDDAPAVGKRRRVGYIPNHHQHGLASVLAPLLDAGGIVHATLIDGGTREKAPYNPWLKLALRIEADDALMEPVKAWCMTELGAK